MFKLEFETDNAVFHESPGDYLAECSKRLTEISERLSDVSGFSGNTNGYICDSNGNTIGQWSYEK